MSVSGPPPGAKDATLGPVIHDDHPFVPPVEDRNPVRRLRGRLPAAVTIVTAGRAEHRAGLTVSSLMVAEGDPGTVLLLAGHGTELLEQIQRTGRFVVHVLEDGHRASADAFAGLRPAPGGPFSEVEVADGEWGPVLGLAATRAFCSYSATVELPHHALVQGAIERVEVHDLDEPLVYFRGAYRRLSAPRGD